MSRAAALTGALLLVAGLAVFLVKALVYEVPLLGADFTMLRLIVSLPLPVLAGWLARYIPIRWAPPDAAGAPPAEETRR